VLSPHDQCQRENSFDRNFSMDSLSALGPQFGSMSMGGSFGGGGARRGILSGNVPEFRYKDYEDDDDAEY